MSSQDREEENRLNIRELQTRFEFIESALKNQSALLHQMNEKLDNRLNRVENRVTSLRAQLKIITAIVSMVVATLISLLFFKI